MAHAQAHSLFTEFDIDLFKAGKHYRLYEKFGSHIIEVDGIRGTYFAVWAPSAKNVSVIGDFNFWIQGEHQLHVGKECNLGRFYSRCWKRKLVQVQNPKSSQ